MVVPFSIGTIRFLRLFCFCMKEILEFFMYLLPPGTAFIEFVSDLMRCGVFIILAADTKRSASTALSQWARLKDLWLVPYNCQYRLHR